MSTKTKVTTYSRRAWWPSGWSVEKLKGRWCVVNKDTGETLHRCEADEREIDAVTWADCWRDG